MVRKYGKSFRDAMSAFNEKFEFENYSACIPNSQLIKFIKANPQKQQFIVTNQNRLLLNKLLLELGIAQLIERTITRDDVLFIKPDPEGILKLIDPTVPLSQYIYVGDSDSDAIAAKAARIEFERVENQNKN